MEYVGCSSVVLVPRIEEILQSSAADWKHAYYLAWIFARRHLTFNLDSFRFVCADLKLESTALIGRPCSRDCEDYISTTISFENHDSALPKSWACYFIKSEKEDDSAFEISLSADGGRISALKAEKDISDICCALTTDLNIPQNATWPTELLELHFFQVLKISPTKPTYFTERLAGVSNITRPINIYSIAELKLLLSSVKVGSVFGMQWNSDILLKRIDLKAEETRVIEFPNTQSQPYKIDPSTARLQIASMDNSEKEFEAICLGLQNLLQPVVETQDCSVKLSKLVVHLNLEKRSGGRRVKEFDCPMRSRMNPSDAVQEAVNLTLMSLQGAEKGQVILYEGTEAVSFISSLAEELRDRSVPLIWLQYHLYLDKHQGASQAYIRRAFATAAGSGGVIIVMDADLFFPKTSDRKHLQYGRSTFFELVRKLDKSGVMGLVLTTSRSSSDDALGSLASLKLPT